MRQLIQILNEAPADEAARIAAFEALADAQRGAPENAMLHCQAALGGGVLSVLVEHVGDLTHRMSEKPNFIPNAGYEMVKPKVERALRYLRHGYGFQREHEGNMESNARYREITLGEHMAKVRPLLRRYADEHRKLRVYNDMQALARDAAVALGEENWKAATDALASLEGHLTDPVTWASYASQYDPNYGRGHVMESQSVDITALVIKRVISVVPEADEIWFHGSRARGDHKKKSDWDFLVVLPDTTPMDRYAELNTANNAIHAIHSLANIDIQVCRHEDANSTVSPLYFAKTEGEGRMIWKKA